MGFFSFGRQRAAAKKSPSISARIDVAQRGDDHRHWANADALSLDGTLSSTVRAAVRQKARYERLNNSYLAGIADTIAADLVGTGPRLQVRAGSSELNRDIEAAFYDWSTAIDLPGKLRTMRQSKLVDGEAFAVMFNNSQRSGVQLDLRLVECDQVATPINFLARSESAEGSLVDGIEFDEIGNVVAFKVLKFHPGSNYRVNDLDYVRVPAEQMFHWFSQVRPAQNRGLSEVAPCLRLFADLRRYTGAVIAAAETAADFAAFIHSSSPAAEVDEVEAFRAMEIEKRALVTLPEGWNISQLKAEQPTATFGDFRRQIISEIGRCLQIPYAIAALDSSNHNYSSARMDSQLYATNLRVQRDEVERKILDRLLVAWADEALLVKDIVSPQSSVAEWDWSWQWDGKDHVDPLKEANATQVRLQSHTTTLAAEYARQGKSWESELQQRAVELAKMEELGLLRDILPEENYGGSLSDLKDSPDETEDEGDEDEAEDAVAEDVSAAAGFVPPKAARLEAEKGLNWRAKYGRGGTAVGVARARDIKNGKALSIETIGRIVSYFARHEVDKQAEGWSPGEKGFPSAGRIAWALWGGDAMRRAANAIWKRHNNND